MRINLLFTGIQLLVPTEWQHQSLPDPRKQPYDAPSHAGELEVKNMPESRYSGDSKSNTKIGFWIDVLSLIEIGLGGERGHGSNLVIETDPAKIITFDQTEALISQNISDPFSSEYARRPKR